MASAGVYALTVSTPAPPPLPTPSERELKLTTSFSWVIGIPYLVVHIGLLLGVLQSALTKAILALEKPSLEEKTNVLIALNKVSRPLSSRMASVT